MGAVVNRVALADALRPIAKFVDRRDHFAILSHVQLDWTTGDQLLITGTDLDTAASVFVNTICSDADWLPVNAHAAALLASLDHLAGETVKIEVIGKRVVIRGDGGIRRLTQLENDFPHVAGVDADFWPIAAEELRCALLAVRPAISTEETRYYLNGVSLKPHGGSLRMAATDGHRLHVAELPLPSEGASVPEIIIPRVAVSHLLRLLDGFEGDVSYAVTAARTAFAVGPHRLVTKNVDGTYPDYERLLPDAPKALPPKVTLTASAVELRRVAQACGAVSDGGHDQMVRLIIEGGKATALLVGRDKTAEAGEDIDAEVTGPDLTVGFRAAYLRDITALFPEDAPVTLSLADSVAPASFTTTKLADRIGVLMPMKAI